MRVFNTVIEVTTFTHLIFLQEVIPFLYDFRQGQWNVKFSFDHAGI